MILLLLLPCAALVAALPVAPHEKAPLFLHRGATERSRAVDTHPSVQQPEAQAATHFPPNLEQQQPGIPPDQQVDPQTSIKQPNFFTQGGSPVIQTPHGFLPANPLTLAQQPLIFPSYGFLPVFPSPYSNQLFSPYGFPVAPESPFPQAPVNQLPNSPVVPVENAAGPSGATTQQTQQQNPQVIYMLQQPMNPSLGGLSSEELETAAKLNQLGMYMPTVLANLPAGAGAAPIGNQAARLVTKPELPVAGQTKGPPAGVVRPEHRPTCSGSHTNAESFPAGLERAEPEANIVQKSANPNIQSKH